MMTTAKVLLAGYLPDACETDLRTRYEVLGPEDAPDPHVGVIITDGARGVPSALIDALPNLKLIAVNGAGTDAIDLNLAAARGIVVETTGSALADEVADMAIALLLALSRQVLFGDTYVRTGAWERGVPLPLGSSLSGKRMGIFGLGRIGRSIAQRAEAFGMTISYFNRRPRADVMWPMAPSLVEMAGQIDVLVSVAPGGDTTRHAINRDVLQALGKHGYVINVGRGSTIDEAALSQAIEDRVIAGAGLDVFENEPHVHPGLLASPRVVLQPHRGSATTETRERMGRLVLERVNQYFLDKAPRWKPTQ